MIPKIIHYCWFSGDPLPPLFKKCIDSWHKNLTDYNIILWDANKIAALMNENTWVRESYQSKKYSFTTDYIRLYAIYTYGGIYLDADVEVIKNFDLFLNETSFTGLEATGDIEAAVIGAEKGCKWIETVLAYYNALNFIKPDGQYNDDILLPALLSHILKINGNSVKNESIYFEPKQLRVFPCDYFSPKNTYSGEITLTERTHTIHHFDASWVNKSRWFKLKKRLHILTIALLGEKIHMKMVHLIRKKTLKNMVASSSTNQI